MVKVDNKFDADVRISRHVAITVVIALVALFCAASYGCHECESTTRERLKLEQIRYEEGYIQVVEEGQAVWKKGIE